jgi:hypothetical protein
MKSDNEKAGSGYNLLYRYHLRISVESLRNTTQTSGQDNVPTQGSEPGYQPNMNSGILLMFDPTQ